MEANLILGFPGQTAREVLETLWFLVRVAVVGGPDVSIYLFSLYPGSQLYREFRAAGRLPEPGDEYFRWLSTYLDLSFVPTVSFTENLTARQPTFLRYFATALFYSVSVALRPWRVPQTIYRLCVGRYETVLEPGLASLIARRLRRQQPSRSAAVVPVRSEDRCRSSAVPRRSA